MAVVTLAALASPSTAQEPAAEPHIKAAFLFNFLKFIEWPADVLAAGPLTVCVAGNPRVAESLRSATTRRRAADREVVVVQLDSDMRPMSCHLVYIAQSDERTARQWLAALRGSTAFTLSDCERFAQLGGVANFFVEGGRLRFAVNMDAARRASLHISSRMLALATIVRDETDTREAGTLR